MKGLCIATALALGVGITALPDVAARGGAEMRSVLVDIELTDQQYASLERMAQIVREDGGIAWSTRDEINLLASGAVIDAATREMHREAIRHAQIWGAEIPHNPEKFANPEGNAAKTDEKEAKTDENGKKAEMQGGRLTKSAGVYHGPSGKETWYNLNMAGVIDIMRRQGYDAERFPFSIRDDGCKMLGGFIMVAANLEKRPRGTIVETSLGIGIVCDTGTFCKKNTDAIDIAVNW